MAGSCRLEQLLLNKKDTKNSICKTPAPTTGPVERKPLQSSAKSHSPVKLLSVGKDRRRYACPKCPYSTDRRDLFTRHENIHRDEKPFRCYVCNKMFNRADHVKKHFLRIHKGLGYDVKLTRRVKGVDYDIENSPSSAMNDRQSGKGTPADIAKTGCIRDSNAIATETTLFTSQLVNRLNSRVETVKHLYDAADSSSAVSSQSQLKPFLEDEVLDTADSPFNVEDCELINSRSGTGAILSQGPERHSDVETKNRITCHISNGRETREEVCTPAALRTTMMTTMSPSSAHSSSSRSSLEQKQAAAARLENSILRLSSLYPDSKTFNPEMTHKDTGTGSLQINCAMDHQCDVCGCAFADFPSLHTHRYLLHRHVNRPRKPCPYKCLVCGFTASSQTVIVGHMSLHCALRQPPYYCSTLLDTCSRQLSRRKQILPRKVVKPASP